MVKRSQWAAVTGHPSAIDSIAPDFPFLEGVALFPGVAHSLDLLSGECSWPFVTLAPHSNPESLYWKARLVNLLNGRGGRLAAVRRPSLIRAAPPGWLPSVPSEIVFVTLRDQARILDCGVHVLRCEVIVVLATLEASPMQPAPRLRPIVLPAPEQVRTVALSVAVDADARRISQALTVPEYLEAWICMPDHAGDSQIVASKREDGYRLDQIRAGCFVASFIGSFLFCHQRKMRLSWRDVADPGMTESLVDFRIRGNFASSILELRHTALPSAREFFWYQQFWGVSLARLATILRSA